MTSDELQHHYLACSAKLFSVARAMLNDDAEAEDAVQDAFVAIWQRRERLAAFSSEEARNYFVTAVRHICINLRRNSHNVRLDDEALAMVGEEKEENALTPYEMAALHNEREVLQNLLAKLPAKQAEAFRLFHFEEMENGEVAQRMGETEAYVRLLLSRARKALRDIYQRKEL